MGCDIHFYVEHHKDGEWVSVDKWTAGADERLYLPMANRFYHERSYVLFSILAGVRNNGDFFTPISQPRGIPKDLSKQVREIVKGWSLDGHSHTYFTVQELMDFDWTQTVTEKAWVNGPEFLSWNEYGRRMGNAPDQTQRFVVMDEAVVEVSEEAMEELMKGKDQHTVQTLANTICPVSWEEPYYRYARFFLSETMPKLWRVGPPDKVRVVFFFDN